MARFKVGDVVVVPDSLARFHTLKIIEVIAIPPSVTWGATLVCSTPAYVCQHAYDLDYKTAYPVTMLDAMAQYEPGFLAQKEVEEWVNG